MTRFDSAKATTWDWVVIGAGALACVSSFLPWYWDSISVLGIERSVSENAWKVGFGAWFSVLLLVVAGGLMLVSMMVGRLRLPAPRSLIALGLSALAVVTILLQWVQEASSGSGDLGNAGEDSFITASREAGFGLYLGLIAAIAAVAASVLAFRAKGGNVSQTPSSIRPPST